MLPPEILSAVSAPRGRMITLVVGAGCSLEPPTGIPLARVCSQESHDRLVADGVLFVGDCTAPSDLSALADTVKKKTGSQRALVEQLLQHYELKAASPNDGHLLAAALLREGAIAYLVTLNFDLALTAAIAGLGVGDVVDIVNGPDDLHNPSGPTLYYLHRNANETDHEKWVLRSAAIRSEWKENWEHVIAGKVLSTSLVIFVGLGSLADVLIESTKLIRKAVPNASKTFLVDPAELKGSQFFARLDLDRAAFVQATWCEFMAALSDRLVTEQVGFLGAAADGLVQKNRLPTEDLAPLLEQLRAIGLLGLGALRANWLLHNKRYFAEAVLARDLIADLLLAVSLIARESGAAAILSDDGMVLFKRGDRVVAAYVLVSGRGWQSRTAIESELASRHRRFRRLATQPVGAIVAGVVDGGPVTPPANVLIGDRAGSIIFGSSELVLYTATSLRQNPSWCKEVAP